MTLLAQAVGGYSIVQIAIAIIIIIAVIGIVLIFSRVAGIAIPQWVWAVIGIAVAAFVCIVAIKFVAGL